MPRFLRGVGLLVAVLLGGYGLIYWNNNRTVPMPSAAEVDASWERSVRWLLSRRLIILLDFNQMLWWMVGQSADAAADPRLQALYRDFLEAYGRRMPDDVWHVFFVPERFRDVPIPVDRYRNLPDYHKFFLYSAACAEGMAGDPSIVEQSDPGYCWRPGNVLRPACTTHQLMGFRLAQRNHCNFPELDSHTARLQTAIRLQLSFDPRVVDVYIQRLAMLVDSGDPQGVEPRWVQRMLKAQLPDGSWSDMQPLLPLGRGRFLNATSSGFAIGAPEGQFHTTAQAVWLLSMLRDRTRAPAGALRTEASPSPVPYPAARRAR